MFDRLSEGLSRALDRIRGGGNGEEARAAFLAGVRDQLLDADAHPDVVHDLIDRLGARLQRDNADHSLAPSQRFLKDLGSEVARLLGGEPDPLRLRSTGTSVVMLVGLQGTGKTTTAGKLAGLLKKQGKSVMLLPLDVKRPAAIEQLGIVGAKVGVPVWQTPPGGKPDKEAKYALKEAERTRVDVLIADTAGRLAIDDEMMRELEQLRERLRPQEVLYVLDAMAGRSAVATAETFAARVRPTGIVLSKVDADARGGAVLSVRARTHIPIKLMGTGEHLDAIEPFDPARVTARLLDLGDLQGLAEKFDAAVDADEAQELGEKFLGGRFTLDDFARQLELMNNLGSIETMLGMLPGGKAMLRGVKNLSVAENEMRRTLAIIRSMTADERRNPKLVGHSHSRKQRVARGSGTSTAEVQRVIKRYDQMKKMMRQLSRFPLAGLKSMLGGGGSMPGGFPGGLPPGIFGKH